jgi:hypothetical protein
MKRQIGTKTYDSDRAYIVASWDNGLPPGDPAREDERLHRSKSGLFFIYGQGGPASKYAKLRKGEWLAGEGITPISVDDAVALGRERMTDDDFQREFTRGGKDEGGKIAQIKMSPEQAGWLKSRREQTGETYNDIIRSLIAQQMEREASEESEAGGGA